MFTSFKKFAFAFGAGAVTGAVLGLLYAPTTGKKLQKRVSDVSEKVIDLQQSVRKMANA